MAQEKVTIAMLLKFERVQRAYEFAKALSISFGAAESQFLEADAQLRELESSIKKAVSGGVVSKETEQSGASWVGELVILPENSERWEQLRDAGLDATFDPQS